MGSPQIIPKINPKSEKYIVDDPTKQIELLHSDTDGWIAMCKKKPDQWIQYHYKYYEIASDVSEWVDNDSYVSMNTFYSPKRYSTNLREIRAFYVDLDCYNVGLTPEQVVMNLKTDYFDTNLPTPNLINYSGRGVNLIWFLDPISGLAINRWNKLQKKILDMLKPLGSDEASTDASRVFRLAGSTNSKSGKTVYAELLHNYKYDFQEVIEEYFPAIKQKNKPKTKERLSNKKKANVNHIFTEYSLVKTRMKDLDTLIQLRQNEIEGCREVLLFLYRYWSLVDTNDYEKALNKIIELNNTLTNPLPINEISRDTKSAEMYYDSEEGFQISNEKLIKWLHITKEEQSRLATIIGRGEKRKRNTECQRKIRGSVSRGEYDSEREQNKQKLIANIKELKQQGLSNKKIAKSIGISSVYVGKLLNN